MALRSAEGELMHYGLQCPANQDGGFLTVGRVIFLAVMNL